MPWKLKTPAAADIAPVRGWRFEGASDGLTAANVAQEIAQWCATADEDGQYCFAVAP